MKKNKNPIHVSVILDGNRRYAKKHGLKLWQGHSYGLKKVENLFKWCKDLGIKELTLYTFSSENFNRKKSEVRYLMNLFRNQIKRLKNDKKMQENKLRVNFIGRLDLFPKDIQKEMRELMKKTSKYKEFKVNFAMGYGARNEIVDATKNIIKKIKNKEMKLKDINEKTFEENLNLKNNPDILIRPGGEKRLSNFLLWQLSYAELYFTKKLWPEFTKRDLITIINDYKKRDRRFGR